MHSCSPTLPFGLLSAPSVVPAVVLNRPLRLLVGPVVLVPVVGPVVVAPPAVTAASFALLW